MVIDDLLIELYTEEIPASYQANAFVTWRRISAKLLQENLLQFKNVEVFATPRRMALLVHELNNKQETIEEELKGPPKKVCYQDSKSTKALEGFAKKAGIALDRVEFKEIGGSDYAYAEVKKGGASIEGVLAGIIDHLIFSVKFAKSMRWGDSELSYARPIISLLVQYGERHLELKNLTERLSEITQTTKINVNFQSGQEEALSSAKDYHDFMQSHGILVNPEERKSEIEKQLTARAQEVSAEAIIPSALLNEVNYLVERPNIIRAAFPQEYLELPDIVIRSEMEEHQKYFAMAKQGKLNESFLVVTNCVNPTEQMRIGNERVLNARLSDGIFFYHQDRSRKLIDFVADLRSIAFLPKLGDMFDKKERLKLIAGHLLSQSDFQVKNQNDVNLACDLVKADLSSQLVYEFDHLQGAIGKIYAGLDGHGEEVASAILEHYLPRHQGDDYPTTSLGVILSLSEKLDNIISGFLVDKQPTSSTDPLGLRRQALYFIEILIEQKMHLSLPAMLKLMYTVYPEELTKNNAQFLQLTESIWEFFRSRLATIFDKQGFDKKLINAGLFTGSNDIYDLYLKLISLKSLKEDENFMLLMTAFKRMNNILEDFKKSENTSQLPEIIQENHFEKDEEKKLFALSKDLRKALEQSMMNKNYEDFFKTLIESKSVVDHFFDNVMVMHENTQVRNNRMALLNATIHPLKQLFDLNELK